MVKKCNKSKAAPFLARSREDEIKRRITVEEADANWARQESKKDTPRAEPEVALGAIEEAFISYSPMSEIANEEPDDTSADEILPFEETMSDSGRNSEDGTSAGNSVGDVGKPAGNDIESNRSGMQTTTEEIIEGRGKTTSSSRTSTLLTTTMEKTSRPSGSSMERNPSLPGPSTERKTSKAKVAAFSQEDFDTLEELRAIPFGRLTGRQQEDLHGTFYRKHSERNTKYMNCWETQIHMYFETLADGKDITQSVFDTSTRNATSGLVGDSFHGGFTPIQQTQRYSGDTRGEPIRYAGEESIAPTKYIPTTKDVLMAYDRVKRDREDRSSDETHSRSSRASPRPETLSPAVGKRTRVESPTRGHIITSVAASDFTPMDDDITPEMATNFERQVGRLPTGMTVANCVVGKAYTSLNTRLRTDRDQDFIEREYLGTWRSMVTLNTLSRMLMKYYGPQTETGGTIEQALRALPFEFNYSDEKMLNDTIFAHVTLMEAYTRTNGNLTPTAQKAIAALLEKRMVQNSALYMDYKEAKISDSAEDGYVDTWLDALHRWARVIQNVREIVAIAAKYGNLKKTWSHFYKDDNYSENMGTLDLREGTNKTSSSKVTTKSSLKITSTSFNTVEPAAGLKSVSLDKPIAKRAQEPDTSDEHDGLVTGTATCHRCGQKGHRAEICPFLGATDTNRRTEVSWSESLIGRMWKRCGHDFFDASKTLPDIQDTYKARQECNQMQTHNNKDNNNNDTGGRNNDNRGNNDSRGGYDNRGNNNKKPFQRPRFNYNGDGNANTGGRNNGNNNDQRCKVSHHVLAALNNKSPTPDFLPAQLFLLQQMSRRGATTMAKDPTEAPPNSVLAQVLLDSGSLAGDFISRDMLLRLQGEVFVYKTAQPLKVCSGMNGQCVIHTEMLDIGMVVKSRNGVNKLVRLSVRINTSSSCDLIIGRASLRKHDLYRFIPGVFGDHDTDPEIPFDELRWVNDRNKGLKRTTAEETLPGTNIMTSTTRGGKAPQLDRIVLPIQTTEELTTQSQTVVAVTAVLTPAPEGTGDTSTQTVSQTRSSVGNLASCVCQRSHCLANSAPKAVKQPKQSASNKKRKKQAERDRAIAQAIKGQQNPVTLAALTEQADDEDLSPMTWNPSRVVLAVDDIDNDKTDTFAPFVTRMSPTPAASFLDEITFGGDAHLQRGLRELCSEYADIFSDTLPKKAADLKPFEIHVDKTKWEQDKNRRPTRPQSSKKMTEIKKHEVRNHREGGNAILQPSCHCTEDGDLIPLLH